MLSAIVRVLPATIHPMLVHFPIALMFTAVLFDAVGLLGKREGATQAGFALLTLGLVSLGATAAAGWVSEHSVHLHSAGVRQILAAHKRDAVLTSLMFAAVWLDRVARRGRYGLGARWIHLAGALVGLAMLWATASLGGALVYEHGVGVATVALGVIMPS